MFFYYLKVSFGLHGFGLIGLVFCVTFLWRLSYFFVSFETQKLVMFIFFMSVVVQKFKVFLLTTVS